MWYLFYLIGNQKDLLDKKGKYDSNPDDLETLGFTECELCKLLVEFELHGEIFSYLEICTEIGKRFVEINDEYGFDYTWIYHYHSPNEELVHFLIEIALKLKEDTSKKAIVYVRNYS